MLHVIVGYSVVILMVAFGLGFVIFVHELGHFVVAKLCGVKCEKFYLGFDIAGLKLCKFRWGETEYGIGILPLGGYVKMLGQEDNPAKLREEVERAKQKAEGGRGKGDDTASQRDVVSQPQALANVNQQSTIDNQQSASSAFPLPPSPLPYDPRSFLAKSVPQRMAIISAGVIMNVIFAFLMAVVAFSLGVEQIPCVVGEVFSGYPAWQADIRSGDHILKIAGKEMAQFRDLQTAILLGDNNENKGVPIEIQRPGVKKPFTVIVKPDNSLGAFFIGVVPGRTTQLTTERITWLVQKRNPVAPGSAAALAKPPFLNGDTIVQIDGVHIEDYGQLNTELARKADKKITVVVSRDEDANTKRLVSIPVDRNPMRTLGLVMKMGPVTAVQADSPAVAAGIEAGDLILKIDDKPVEDPMTLPDQLIHRAGETAKLTLRREGSAEPVVLSATLRKPMSYSGCELEDSPVEASALGITYRVLNRVERVIEGSPAAKAGLQPGDVLVEATLTPPRKKTGEALDAGQKELTLKFNDDDKRNWPPFCSVLQVYQAGTSVELTVLRNEKKQTTSLNPVDATDWFNPERGLLCEPLTCTYRAKSVGEAFTLGGRETLDWLTFVFRSVKALGTAQVSPRNLVGPVGLIGWAINSADQGSAKLLIFLTMLSANLAVINFLPIPLLDGGLMMFLIYEGVRGKPANERVQVVLTYIGLIFILALMVWVCGLDVFRLIARW